MTTPSKAAQAKADKAAAKAAKAASATPPAANPAPVTAPAVVSAEAPAGAPPTPPVDNDHIAPGSERFADWAKTVTPTESPRVKLNRQLEDLEKLPRSKGRDNSIIAVKNSLAALDAK